MKRRRRSRPRKQREPLAITQARLVIRLAKSERVPHLRVGEIEVAYGPPGEPHDQIGFDAAPTPPDEYYEAKRRR